MKVTVIGGTGLIGKQVVENLTSAGHEAVAAATSTGVDVITGAGLDTALAGADVCVNLTNSPTFDEKSLDFFRTSMTNIRKAAESAQVGHQVILSIVGVDQVPKLDYYRAKALQEELVAESSIPYSIVRATQFFEFVDSVLTWVVEGTEVHLPTTPIQPIAGADVAATVARVATEKPLNGIENIAGPDVFTLDKLGEVTLAAKPDGRSIVVDETAGMFAAVDGDVLTANGKQASIADTRYKDWLERS